MVRDLLEDSLLANEKKKHGQGGAGEDDAIALNTNNNMWVRYKGQSTLTVIDEITALAKEVEADDCAKLAPGGKYFGFGFGFGFGCGFDRCSARNTWRLLEPSGSHPEAQPRTPILSIRPVS